MQSGWWRNPEDCSGPSDLNGVDFPFDLRWPGVVNITKCQMMLEPHDLQQPQQRHSRRVLPQQRRPHQSAAAAVTSRPLSALALRSLLQSVVSRGGGGGAGAGANYAVSGRRLVVPGVLSLPTIQLNNINVFPKSSSSSSPPPSLTEEEEVVLGEQSVSDVSAAELPAPGQRAAAAVLSYAPPTSILQEPGAGNATTTAQGTQGSRGKLETSTTT